MIKNDHRRDRRLLCSDLMTVHWGSGRGSGLKEVAVLEDYSTTGASLYLAARIEPGTAITLRTAGGSFRALVLRCAWRDNGYLLGVEFDEPGAEEFKPDHLLDPEQFAI